MTDLDFKIKNLLMSLNSNSLNLKKIKYQMDLISKFNEYKENEYLEDLLNPANRKGVRIPSQFPVPSATFQLHSSFKISSNANGCFLCQFNPYFLGNENLIGAYDQHRLPISMLPAYTRYYMCSPISTFGIIDSPNLDGKTELDFYSSFFKPIDIGQILPGNIYEQYRLVSAETTIRYVGPMDETQGFLGGSIVFDPLFSVFCKYYVAFARDIDEFPPFDPNEPTISESFNKIKPEFTVFSNLRHTFYNQENSCSEGIRMLYFPVDNKYEEFSNICNGSRIKYVDLTSFQESQGLGYFDIAGEYFKSGFQWILYGSDLPVSKEYFKVDVFCNFECLPSSSFMSYCPLSMNPNTLKIGKKNEIREKMKTMAIQKCK